jgi:NTE family protein
LPRGITSGQKLSNLLTDLCYRAGVRSSISFDLLNPPFRAVTTDLVTGKLEIISAGDLAEAMRASMSFPVGFTPVVTEGRLFVDGGLINPVPVELCREIAGGPVVAVNTTAPLLPITEITNAIDMANQSTTVMSLPNLETQLNLADVVITPNLGYHKSFDFKNIETIINAGRAAAAELVPLIKRSLDENHSTSGREFVISDVTIEGLRNLPESFFSSAVSYESNQTDIAIKSNLNQIIRSGFVYSAHAELEESSSYKLKYILQDNPRIKGFAFIGLTKFSPQTILMHLHSQVGEVANYNTFIEDIDTIEKLYAKSGYTLARVKFPQIDPQSGIVSVVVDEGKIQQVGVSGNNRTRRWLVLRDFNLKPGEVFSANKAQRSLDDLYGTGLFETVKLTAQPCSTGVALTVKVEEKSFDYLRTGIRYDNEYKTAGFVDLVSMNVFGLGNEVNISGQFGERKRAYQLNIKADRILKTYLTYRLTISHSLFKRNYYIDHDLASYVKEVNDGVELEIGQQYRRLGKLSATLELSDYSFQEPDNLSSVNRNLIALSIRSQVDNYDALPFPETGKNHFFELEFAGDVLGGDIIYSKFYTSLEAYYPLPYGLNLHPRGELGFFNRTPPYFKKFFLGGRNSFYGLFEHEFGGAKIFSGSLELRKRITDYLFITGRYDSGKVWNKLESIRFDQLEHSIGGSIMVKSAIGPVGMAYGRTSTGLDAFYIFAGYDY